MARVAIPQRKDMLTVEISEEFLKLVLYKGAKDKPEITHAACLEIKGKSDADVSEAIKDFAKQSAIKKAEAVNIIPSQLALTKNIEIPSVDPKEIKEIIDLQAGRHTPYSREEIIMDYCDIGIFHERYTKILLVIVKREEVVRRMDIIKQAGFSVLKTILSAEAVAQWCNHACQGASAEKPSSVISVDSSNTDFIVFDNDKILYLRSIPFTLMDIYAQPSEAIKQLTDELKKSAEAYQSENINGLPRTAFLVGATDAVAGSKDKINEAIGIGVDIPDYAGTMPLSQEVQKLIQQKREVSFLSVFATPFVYENVRINLIPEDVKLKQEIKLKAHEATKTGIFVMALLVIFCITLVTNTFFKSLYLKQLLQKYTKETQEAQRYKNISDRTGIIKKFLNQKGQSLFVLTELYNAIPNEVYLSSISFKDDATLTFTGTTDSMSRVFSLVTDLENNTLFKNVKVDFTKTRTVKGKEVADFGLTLSLEERA